MFRFNIVFFVKVFFMTALPIGIFFGLVVTVIAYRVTDQKYRCKAAGACFFLFVPGFVLAFCFVALKQSVWQGPVNTGVTRFCLPLMQQIGDLLKEACPFLAPFTDHEILERMFQWMMDEGPLADWCRLFGIADAVVGTKIAQSPFCEEWYVFVPPVVVAVFGFCILQFLHRKKKKAAAAADPDEQTAVPQAVPMQQVSTSVPTAPIEISGTIGFNPVAPQPEAKSTTMMPVGQPAMMQQTAPMLDMPKSMTIPSLDETARGGGTPGIADEEGIETGIESFAPPTPNTVSDARPAQAAQFAGWEAIFGQAAEAVATFGQATEATAAERAAPPAQPIVVAEQNVAAQNGHSSPWWTVPFSLV